MGEIKNTGYQVKPLAAAKGLTEAQIQRQIKTFLQWKGWFVFKIHQSALSYKGIADLCAIKGGRTLWLEVKKPGGRQSQHQKQFEADVESHGGEYAIVTSMEDTAKIIEGERE